ncbi:MAG: Re/Si-specific NAD(P)(+) transhydrogenase subunit alpha [Armatimonadota bacterium]
MHIVVPKESTVEESRVALTPVGAKDIIALGHTLSVESQAGEGSFITDREYEVSGASLGNDLATADILLKVLPPTEAEIAKLKSGAITVSFLNPSSNPSIIEALRAKNITSFAIDMMPRISRAQSMDALSSMSTIAGYKAALLCASHLPKFFPMLMTAAGTMPAARVLVIGAGVAGLQAIATCRRLGAVVEAFDVRPAVKEQIESLGGKFVGLSLLSEEAEDVGGYAKEVTGDTHSRELELIASRLPNVDCVITTAVSPGKRAPTLITDQMIKQMRPGSVIVDLAAPSGGNCEFTVPGQITKAHAVTIIGSTDLLSTMVSDATKMYSKNLISFLGTILKDGALNIDMEDEIIRGTLITYEGKIVHDVIRLSLERPGS